MSKIKNIEGLTLDQINAEVSNGAKFVVFQYCFSVIVMTFKRVSAIYFIRAGESTAQYSKGFSALTAVAGWWGIPWGPIYTIGSLSTNIKGGKDITKEVLASLNAKQ
ncbi:hypothetical protein BH11BAC3_BH11BAC3_35580 [soil metagenome]